MARERTRFAWTWAGILAGVVVAGASYGPRPEADSGTSWAARELQLAQVDPTSPSPGAPSVPGVTPPPGSTSVPGSEPVYTGTDAGVGGSGFYVPPSTLPDAGVGGSGLPSTPGVIEPGVGDTSVTTPSVGVPTPSVGGQDGGMGF